MHHTKLRKKIEPGKFNDYFLEFTVPNTPNMTVLISKIGEGGLVD